MARRFARTAQDARPNRDLVVVLYSSHWMGLESALTRCNPIPVRHGRGRLFPHASEVSHRMDDAPRTGPRAGHAASQRQPGRRSGPLLVQLMLERMSWRYTFACLGAVGIVWAIPFYRWYRDDPRQQKSVNAAELALLTAGAHDPAETHRIPWKSLLSSPTVWLLCAQWFCFDYGFYFFLTWFPTYIQEATKFTPHTGAVLAGLPLLAGGLGCLVAAWLEPILSGPARRNAQAPRRLCRL